MTILKESELPETADQYFEFYHERTKETPGREDIKGIIQELRYAFKKYEDRKPRITSMAYVMKIALSKDFKKEEPQTELKELAKEILFQE